MSIINICFHEEIENIFIYICSLSGALTELICFPSDFTITQTNFYDISCSFQNTSALYNIALDKTPFFNQKY